MQNPRLSSGAAVKIAALALLVLVEPASTARAVLPPSNRALLGSSGSDDTLLAIRYQKCKEDYDFEFKETPMHQCFNKCRSDNDCEAIVFDSTKDLCRLYNSCTFTNSDSETKMLFLPSWDKNTKDELEGIPDLFRVNPGSVCEESSIAKYEGEHAHECADLCEDNSMCNFFAFNDGMGDPKSQSCRLFKSCNKRDTQGWVMLFTPIDEKPCKNPVIVVCKKGSTSQKCLEYCGASAKKYSAQEQDDQCGGVIYMCQ